MKKLIITLSCVLSIAGCNSTGGYKKEPITQSSLAPEMSVERLLRDTHSAKDLHFPSDVTDINSVKYPKMSLFKPDGAGPFPALVLAHQCGGLDNSRTGWKNLSMLEWSKKAVRHGYVVLLIDQLTQRGIGTRCKGKAGGLNFGRSTKDVFQAADHLRKFDFVEPDKIAVAGYSFGAILAALASSNRWGETLQETGRFAAAVSFYPGCYTIRPRRGLPYEIVNTDIDKPLLVLLGEKDTETPAHECSQKLEIAKSNGSIAEWHIYSDTTHCWDCENLDGHSKVTNRGLHATYRYSEAATKDSEKRMFDFLRKHLN
ncbi:MAG: dienelactone hydrolase family protein [Sedimenticola sp.]